MFLKQKINTSLKYYLRYTGTLNGESMTSLISTARNKADISKTTTHNTYSSHKMCMRTVNLYKC